MASQIDYPKEKSELANLVNQLNILDNAATVALGPQLNNIRNQILKLRPSYEDKKQKVTLYEKTKNKLDESNKKLGIALEQKKKAEGKKKKAQDKKEKENKRKKPGTATGKGKKVGDKWLNDAGKDNGVPIPEQVANKLRDKKFNNFDTFRKSIWKEISKFPELIKNLKPNNRTNVSKGNSPFVRKEDQVGGRKVNELHHDTPISEGGEVYDMDNLRITTPKRHIDIHRGK